MELVGYPCAGQAERQRVDKARAEEARKADETLKEVRRLDRELEKVETRQSQADTTLQVKHTGIHA